MGGNSYGVGFQAARTRFENADTFNSRSFAVRKSAIVPMAERATAGVPAGRDEMMTWRIDYEGLVLESGAYFQSTFLIS